MAPWQEIGNSQTARHEARGVIPVIGRLCRKSSQTKPRSKRCAGLRLPTKAGNAALAIALRWPPPLRRRSGKAPNKTPIFPPPPRRGGPGGAGPKPGPASARPPPHPVVQPGFGWGRRSQPFLFFFHGENFASSTVWSNRERLTRKAGYTTQPPVSSPHDQDFYL